MGIYIEGMKKPKSCSECFGFSVPIYGDVYCGVMSNVYKELMVVLGHKLEFITVRTCDVCNKQIANPKEFIIVKCKSSKYITYANQDSFGANKRKFDICQDCVDKFRQFAKNPSSFLKKVLDIF